MEQVKETINNKTTNFDLLFLNFCYSKTLSQSLIETNIAKHIICIENRVDDLIAKEFAVCFYKLFVKLNSICKAFHETKKQISNTYSRYDVDNKFKLIKQDKHLNDKCIVELAR